MSSIHHYFASTDGVWDSFTCSGKETLDVTEIWRNTDDDADCHVLHRAIEKNDVQEWLKHTDYSEEPDTEYRKPRCVLRIAWIRHERKPSIYDIHLNVLNDLVDTFKHRPAQKSLRTSRAGIARVHSHPSDPQLYYCCNHQKLAVTWSKKQPVGTTSMICIAEKPKIKMLRDIAGSTFFQNQADLELAPALLCAILTCREIEYRLSAITMQVREVEVRTGHHSFQSRSEYPAGGDLFSLSAKMSGCATKLASGNRTLGILKEWNRFILEASQQMIEKGSSQKICDNAVGLTEIIHVLEQRVAIQTIEVEYVKTRVQTQRDALFHLIAENSAITGHEMAKDSRLLAMASHRDSASMKSLAVVSMFFLPGTFVASLFSMPLFNWGDENPASDTDIQVWGPRLVIFISVTGPLMLLTFSIWGLWLLARRTKNRKQFNIVHSQLNLDGQPPDVSEVNALALKRLSST